MQLTHKAGLRAGAIWQDCPSEAARRPGQSETSRPVYNAPNTFGVGVIDAPAFVFENTSGSAITDGLFTIDGGTSAADTFNVGTIAVGGDFILIPGQSN